MFALAILEARCIDIVRLRRSYFSTGRVRRKQVRKIFGCKVILALVHQETQFVGYPLWDFQPVKTFHFWRDMVMFPDVTDDMAAHVLYMLKFVKLILRRTSQEGVAVVNVRQNKSLNN